MDYVVVVMGKYLQMLVAHSIFKEEPDRVTDHFEEFNRDFYKVCDVFKEVTDQVFIAGQEVEVAKPVALVKPIQRESKAELCVSDNERVTLQQFLEMHDLQELFTIFVKEGVAMHDVLEMTDKDMKDLGIKTYSLRKRLLRVIEGEEAGTPMASEERLLDQSEDLSARRGSRARTGSSTETSLDDEAQRKLHLEEAQNSSSRCKL